MPLLLLLVLLGIVNCLAQLSSLFATVSSSHHFHHLLPITHFTTLATMPVNPYLLKGLFNSIMYGVDKVPDSWFDKIPGGYYRTKAEKDKSRLDEEKDKRQRRHRRRSEASRDHDDGPYFSDEIDDRRGKHRSSKDYDDDEYSGRGHHGRSRRKSLGAERGYDGTRWEEPPSGNVYAQPKPYHPAEYAPPGVIEQEEYYNGRAQGTDGTRYAVCFSGPSPQTDADKVIAQSCCRRSCRRSCRCSGSSVCRSKTTIGFFWSCPWIRSLCPPLRGRSATTSPIKAAAGCGALLTE